MREYNRSSSSSSSTGAPPSPLDGPSSVGVSSSALPLAVSVPGLSRRRRDVGGGPRSGSGALLRARVRRPLGLATAAGAAGAGGAGGAEPAAAEPAGSP